MYNQLYAAWRREIDDPTLGALSSDFYAKIADYLKRTREDNKQLDKKSVKASLLEHETKNVNRMLEELLKIRYRKILKTVTKLQKVPTELLTAEETSMCGNFAAFADAYQNFTKSLMQGEASQITQSTQPMQPMTVHLIKSDAKPEAPAPPPQPTRKRLTIRFVKNIPGIMGADMKSYGPFVAEDVASLPAMNAQILIKQGLAVLVEVS